MKWRYNSFDDATSRKIHSSNPFRLEARLARKKVLFHQDNTPSHKSTVAMTKLQIGLWIDSSSTLFSGFGPVWLLSVPKLKNLARWEEILVKWGNHVAVNEYFADFEIAYFKWLPNVNYASFLTEIWPEGVRRVDLSRHQMDCSAISWKFTKLIKRPTYITKDKTIMNFINISISLFNFLR